MAMQSSWIQKRACVGSMILMPHLILKCFFIHVNPIFYGYMMPIHASYPLCRLRCTFDLGGCQMSSLLTSSSSSSSSSRSSSSSSTPTKGQAELLSYCNNLWGYPCGKMICNRKFPGSVGLTDITQFQLWLKIICFDCRTFGNK